VLPSGAHIISAEVAVYFKDTSKTFSLQGPVLEVPLKDLVGHEFWQKDDTGAATALATVKFKAEDGTERVAVAEGLAIILVLKPGYDPLPLDSQVGFPGTLCEVVYSSSGRSSLACGVR
jgi:hypothetical protein